MKIKSDFITNSSSSSFLIMISDNAKPESLVKDFSKDAREYFDYLKGDGELDSRLDEWMTTSPNVQLSDEEKFHFLCKILLGELKNEVTGNFISVDNWRASAGIASNEDGVGLGLFLYEFMRDKDTPNIKFKKFY